MSKLQGAYFCRTNILESHCYPQGLFLFSPDGTTSTFLHPTFSAHRQISNGPLDDEVKVEELEGAFNYSRSG